MCSFTRGGGWWDCTGEAKLVVRCSVNGGARQLLSNCRGNILQVCHDRYVPGKGTCTRSLLRDDTETIQRIGKTQEAKYVQKDRPDQKDVGNK